MNQPRKSNDERALWRAKCREKLSAHLKVKLGLTIPGEDVRLITGRDDPYRWSGLPGTEHLFTKQLSKHCLRSYIEIYHWVGNSFEALPNDTVEGEEHPSGASLKRAVPPADRDQSVKKPRLLTQSESFSSRIRRLEEENHTMKRQLERMTETTSTAAKAQNTLEMSLSAAQTTISQLEEEVSTQREKTRKSQALIIHYQSKAQGLGKCIADVVTAIRRVEKQEREALTPPPVIAR
ncbi:hypothetical protein EPUS_05732 [Endocarpon pusillum Z07020]|uniref:Uncharacterized protein n=1 Tax=Endocarpon pusillum (strain Z07020 / HMAS-L-300199) TaxID=1263415 RepID=U1GAH7_ENDPU|nr:uncharacterized protein EPUS_05732 [Endocarpon pusillum Z07020]ERF68671.1 hypothetical protein EPUS_05732 [Endocarpon pusillum Z07020]